MGKARSRVLIALLVWQSAVWAGEPGRPLFPVSLPVCCQEWELGSGRILQGHPPSTTNSSSPSKERRRSLRWLGAGAALAVASGAIAWWSRNQADQAYDRYLRAASRHRQEKEFHRAERYDRAAGAALLGMEVGIVLTTYWLFF